MASISTASLLDRLGQTMRTSEVYQTLIVALERTRAEPELGEGLRAFWSKAPEQAGLLDLLPKHTDQDAALFGVPSYNMSDVIAAAWLLLCEMLPAFDETVVMEGPLAPKDLLIEGSLRVQGDLVAGPYAEHTPNLIVLGDLIVEGDWTWDGDVVLVRGDVLVQGKALEKSEWSRVIVGGAVRAGGAFSSQGDLVVAGDVHAPVITLTYNHGHALLLSGARSLFLWESDHNRSWMAQAPDARVESLYEMQVEAQYAHHGTQRHFEGLRDILTEAYRERVMSGYVWDAEERCVLDEGGEYVELHDVMREISYHLTLGENQYADVQPPLSSLIRADLLADFEVKT